MQVTCYIKSSLISIAITWQSRTSVNPSLVLLWKRVYVPGGHSHHNYPAIVSVLLKGAKLQNRLFININMAISSVPI